MNKVAIIVPVYRSTMKETELISYQSILMQLCTYPIVLVTPKGLDISCYQQMATSHNITLLQEKFDPHFFKNISGYNRLLLSQGFYQRFSDYEFILIAQLDTYIFRNELLEWCNKDYDYVGAPWVGSFSNRVFDVNKLSVGNGGLSLRKVQSFLRFFNGKKHVIPTCSIASRIGLIRKPYTRWLVWLLMFLGWHNKPHWFEKRYKWNEDGFWCFALNNTLYELRKPQPLEAARFAFERFPSELYQLTKRLPFGCHAWEKYEYEEFWKQWIKME